MTAPHPGFATAQDILARFTGAKPNGSGWTARCPAHDDKRNSLSISVADNGKILLKCHAGCTFDAITQAAGIEPRELFPDSTATKAATKPRISETYDYTDVDGNLVYQVVRFIPKDFRQRRPDGEGGWIWNLQGITPLLYHLPGLVAAIAMNKTVFICEGEKDVHSLEKLGFVATTNSGGASKWRPHFNAIFARARVVILPDNDPPGLKHVLAVAESLYGTASHIRVLHLPVTKRKGDVTDWIQDGGARERFIDLIKACPSWEPGMSTVTDPEPDEPPCDDENPAAAESPTERLPTLSPKDLPFRVLGYDENYYYYYSYVSKKIERLTGPNHQRGNLMMLAPMKIWDKTFPGSKGVNWVWAADYLITASHRVGYFDDSRLRGSGIWRDDSHPIQESIVEHLGDKLIVDGERTSIEEYESHYIYTVGTGIKYEHTDPLPTNEAHKFLEICKALSWEKTISGPLLAGWCVIAPICGALIWRPHVWITGASGTGKTWTIDHIVKPALGPMLLFVQSNSTEAGIRQALGINAFPVLFDEAEGEDMTAQKRVQSILELMRQASSETGAPIIKGSTSGHATEYRVRSCFAVSSIGVNISMKADASRITVLSLCKCHPHDVVDRFEEIKSMVYGTITPDYTAALRARTLSRIPTILGNSEIFGKVIAERFHDTRIGDQFGALLAGAYSLSSTTTIDEDAARAWIDRQDWTEQSSIEDTPDEYKCLDEILQHVIQYQVENIHGVSRYERSIEELLLLDSMPDEASDALKRIGIKVIETPNSPVSGITDGANYSTASGNDAKIIKHLVISDSHKQIKRILKDTPWYRNWGRILKRIDGAEVKAGERFFDKIYRSTSIPINAVMNNQSGE